MDFFAHIFWIFIVFHSQWYFPLAILFGILPDLFSFAPFFFTRMLNKKPLFKSKDHFRKTIPPYVYKIYNTTHSMITFLIFFIPAYLIFGNIALAMIGWLIHIILDIITHEKEFFGTRFLYPLSKFSVNGISWGQKWFIVLNYVLIICLLFLIGFGFL